MKFIIFRCDVAINLFQAKESELNVLDRIILSVWQKDSSKGATEHSLGREPGVLRRKTSCAEKSASVEAHSHQRRYCDKFISNNRFRTYQEEIICESPFNVEEKFCDMGKIGGGGKIPV